MEVQQSYSAAQYVITNYYPISLTKYRLQPSSLTLTHGPSRYPPSTVPATRYIYRRLCDTLPIPGISVSDWRGLEHETYWWGARLITPKERNLRHAISSHNCHYFSTGEPTYWPTDLTKLPDLLDFLVARGIPANYIQVESAFELSCDHSPVIATISAIPLNKAAFPTLTTTHTNWDVFRAYINEHINLHLRSKERAELDDATQYFNTLLQEAAWQSTPHPAQERSL